MPTDNRNRRIVPGESFSIRLDSEDIMSCIDAMELSGTGVPGMGLSQAVKWGLVAMAATLRKQGILPERDGFDYARMIEKFRNPAMAVRVKVGINLAAMEVPLKQSTRSVAIPVDSDQSNNLDNILNETDEDVGDNLPYVVPPDVKINIPCGMQELNVISKRLGSNDINISQEEVAKWLLYSPARTFASNFMSPQQLSKAEDLIESVWDEYPRLGVSNER